MHDRGDVDAGGNLQRVEGGTVTEVRDAQRVTDGGIHAMQQRCGWEVGHAAICTLRTSATRTAAAIALEPNRSFVVCSIRDRLSDQPRPHPPHRPRLGSRRTHSTQRTPSQRSPSPAFAPHRTQPTYRTKDVIPLTVL